MKILNTIFILFLTTTISLAQEAYTLKKEYAINLDGTLHLTSDDAEVFISGTDRANVKVDIHREITRKGLSWGDDDFEIEVYEKDGDLYIEENSRSSNIAIVGYYKEEYTIKIAVPRGVHLNIKGDDDDYIIENMLGNITLDIDDGEAQLGNCLGHEFNFDIDDGDLLMEGGNGKLVLNLDDGDVEIRDTNFVEINAKIDDGDLLIQTVLADNGNYNFNGDDSDIEFEVLKGGGIFEIDHDDSRIYTSGIFETLEDEEDYTKLKLRNGNANVKMRLDDASIKIDGR